MNKYDVICVIPCRMGSSRFPGKPLFQIAGMPMIQHCWERAVRAYAKEKVWISTCDTEIVNFAKSLGAQVLVTSDKHERATERVVESIALIEMANNIRLENVVMLQGDEPLVGIGALKSVAEYFQKNHNAYIVNILSKFQTETEFLDKNNPKAVLNYRDEILYLSREPLPSSWKNFDFEFDYFMQTGIIGFSRQALDDFSSWDECAIERLESIDLNRVLYRGGIIKGIKMLSATIGVDTPEEAKLAEEIMLKDPEFCLYSSN